MAVTIRSGDTEILASGTVISFRANPIQIVLDHDPNEISCRIVVSFPEDSTDSDVFMLRPLETEDGVMIALYGGSQRKGYCPSPIEFMENSSGYSNYINLSWEPCGESVLLTYTIYKVYR